MNEIKITNVGPIKEFSIPLPEKGGVVCLMGKKGCGKSTSLLAIESLIYGGGKLSARDKTPFGTVEGLGVSLRIGQKNRRTGDLLFEPLPGRFDVGAIADPGIDNPASADAKRIKAIVAITGVKADKTPFVELLGNVEDFEAVVSPASLDTDDVIEMAGRIKRDMEKAARTKEDQAEHHSGHAKGLMEGQEELDYSHVMDAEVLQSLLELAIQKQSALKSQSEGFKQSEAKVAAARLSLAKAESEYAGPSFLEAGNKLQDAEAANLQASDAEGAAFRSYEAAKRKHDETKTAVIHAEQIRDAAKQHESMIAVWKSQLAETSAIEEVPFYELEERAEEVTAARQAVEYGSKLRDAIERKERAKKEAEQASELRKEAAILRDAAKSTEMVLSSMVNLDVLRVECGRICCQTSRGKTFYHDLSDGEKAEIAIDIGVLNVKSKGLIVVGQRFWQDLPESDRMKIAKRARQKQIVIFAAQVTDDPIHVELMDGENYGKQ